MCEKVLHSFAQTSAVFRRPCKKCGLFNKFILTYIYTFTLFALFKYCPITIRLSSTELTATLFRKWVSMRSDSALFFSYRVYLSFVYNAWVAICVCHNDSFVARSTVSAWHVLYEAKTLNCFIGIAISERLYFFIIYWVLIFTHVWRHHMSI